MADQLLDGTGGGYLQRVGSDNRSQVRAVIEYEVIHRTENGDSFNWNTGLISISSDSALIYIKNSSDKQMVITNIAMGIFDGLSYTDAPYLTVLRNPTAGDLISDATAVDMASNRNAGSTLVTDGLVYKGKDGGTVSGGENLGILLLGKTGRSFFEIDLILTKGTSFALHLTGNISSGSANVYTAFIGYYKDSEDI